MESDVLAVDFGTSNSAIAVMEGACVRHLHAEGDARTLPTAVFLPESGASMRIGQAAVDALVEGEEGRFMRALKSVLGTPLLHETRMIARRRRTLSETVTAFLLALRERAEVEAGRPFRRVLSGRPVRFHSADAEADARAEADLRACYHAAGFEAVSFLPEPEAAALSSGGAGEGIGLIVDMGGGTSDFSVFRGTPDGPDILASHGIRLGGTDFDRALSMAFAMPELGLGGELRREFGTGLIPVPLSAYADLSTWEMIPFLYTGETRRMVDGMVRMAVDPGRMRRLATVLEDEMGHDLAFAVERGKIDANDGGGAGIALRMIEAGLSVPLERVDLLHVLERDRGKLRAAAARTLEMAGVVPEAVERIVLVGGSSLMGFVGEEMGALCPETRIVRGQAFTAVIDGLAMAAAALSKRPATG